MAALAKTLSLPDGITPRINGEALVITLPIEDSRHTAGANPEQIQIAW
jgi:hypothetical protein